MKVSTILFIIALIFSIGELITSITDHKIISDIFQRLVWSCLSAGWALLFVGH